MEKYVIISGAGGFVGSALLPLLQQEYSLIAVSRRPQNLRPVLNKNSEAISWSQIDAKTEQIGIQHLAGIINLAGENIASGYWTQAKKHRLLNSRLIATEKLMAVPRKYPRWNGAFIQASAIGFYGDAGETILTETSRAGSGFLAGLVDTWEKAGQPSADQGFRPLWLRIGLILGRNGGMLKKMRPLFRTFLGGHPGNGQQWVSWIHLSDLLQFILMALKSEKFSGTYNLVSPQPLPAKIFYREIANTLSRPAFLHPPAFLLKLILGEMANELLLAGQRVLPERLLTSGFQFKFPQLEKALADAFSN